MEMPSGHNPTRSIAWKMPSVPINLTLGGPYVTAGRTVGPRPPHDIAASLGVCDAPADPARPRSSRQQEEEAARAGAGVKSSTTHRGHADGTGTSTPRTPQNSHPGTTSQHPAELLRNNRKATLRQCRVSISPSPFPPSQLTRFQPFL